MQKQIDELITFTHKLECMINAQQKQIEALTKKVHQLETKGDSA